MRKGRAAVIVSMAAGLLGASAACSAVLGIVEFTAGDGGAAGDSGRDGAPFAGDESGPLTCAGEDGGLGVIGCPCSAATPNGCGGLAQSQRLLCTGGTWITGPACTSGSNCDTRPGSGQGMCAAIDTNCTSATPGQAVCVGANVVQCGPDLVSETPVTTCANTCVNGTCGGTCTPGQTECVGNGVQTCGAGGQFGDASTCSEMCSDGGCTTFPSCTGGGPGAASDCGGAAGTTDCCSSREVPGAAIFYRGYDKDISGNGMAYPAAVSSFRLDQYEVTVGRFRPFVTAVVNGWDPDPGSGKHSHLNGGNGLTAVGTDAASSESGWSMAWNANLTTQMETWNTNLACDGNASWTASPAGDEHRPIDCITWYEAYAFCIWDGGFLPSDTEWNYAAAGGTDQRAYPWSTSTAPNTIDCSYANYNPGPACSTTGLDDVGSDSPMGDGKYGQADLAGNVWEWTLDAYGTYQSPCNDCANLSPLPSNRVTHGGSFNVVAPTLYSTYRNMPPPDTRDSTVGVRCARVP